MRTQFQHSRAGELEEAKRRLPIPELWRRLALPGEPGKSCRSPFREDRSASFSIFADGMRWMDHATGEKGDAVDFLAKAQNLTVEKALLGFLEMAGIKRVNGPRPIGHILTHEMRPNQPRLAPVLAPATGTDSPVYGPPFHGPPSEKGSKPHFTLMVERIHGPHRSPIWATVLAPISLPQLKGGTPELWADLARTRKLPSEKGLILGENRGLLGFCAMRDGAENAPAWLITDAKRANAQARRLDGLPWQALPGKPKARTLRGSLAAWPIGAADMAHRTLIILCEGGPDLLAALTAIACHAINPATVGAVAMIGASLAIPAEALPLFSGKCVRIVPHLDKAGASAALKWDAQLTAAGASVAWFDLRPFLPPGGKDLNDALAHNADALAPLVRMAGDEDKEAA